MRVHSALFPVAIVAFALSSAIAATAEQRRGRDRDNQETTGQARERARGGREQRDAPPAAAAPQRESRSEPGAGVPAAPPERRERAVPRDGGRNAERNADRGAPGQLPDRGGARQDNGADRRADRYDRRDDRRDDRSDNRRDDRLDRRDDRWDDRRDDRRDNRSYNRWDGRNSYGYRPPRLITPRRAVPRRYYGPGGNFSVFFGWGSGYRFGSWYSGRVYGYVPPYAAYGAQRYYGDVRLQVRPRFAEVYVDGYYAGLVDNFDGVFQRLTLEVGPHEIEIVAPGYEPQYYEVYVDPNRTVDLYGDLYPSGYRP